MPLYEFQCTQCGSVFEIRASFKEKEAGLEPECPQCHSKEVKQVLTTGLFIRGNDGTRLSMPGCGPAQGPGCC